MSITKFLRISVFSFLFPLAALAQQDVKVEFFTPSIVHVVKGQPTKTLVITAQPGQVEVDQQGPFWKSSELIVRQDAQGRLTFLTAKGKVLLREKDCDVAKARQTFLLDKDEAIYGLGTIQNGKMNRRGEHKRMEQSNLEDFQNVLQSVKGWGLYWENYSPTQFDDDANGMTFDSEVGEGVDYYFMYGGSADGVIAQMRHLSGDVPMFPLWTYGFWQSKERYKTAAETESIVDQYRALQVPLDGIIQDWQYWGSNYLWNAMDFLSEDFATGPQMIKNVHAKHAHFMISIWASFGPQTQQFRELNDKGLLLPIETWPQSGLSHIWPPRMDYPSGVKVYDAFSPVARDIYWKHLKRLYDYGTDAWWMDSTDPDFFNPRESDYAHPVTGGTWRQLRNAFPLETVRGVYQAQRDLGNHNSQSSTLNSPFHVGWRVKFEPGEAKVVARKGGQVVGMKTMRTAGQPDHLRLTVDYDGNRQNANYSPANGRHLVFVRVEVVDRDGNLCPWAENQVFFDTTRGVQIVGVDNGSQFSMERFKDNKRKAFFGRCLVVLDGHGTLSAKAIGLKTATIQL